MSDIDYKLRWYSPWKQEGFDTVRLEISVGQEYHEGNKLKVATAWAKRNFPRVVAIVGDSIQGYNFAISRGIDLQSACRAARLKGDEWLDRNSEALKGVEITRWDDWLNHSEYSSNHKAINSLYHKNAEFREHIDETIESFRLRRQAAGESGERFTDLSRQFLLEETAVFSIAYKELRGISAYPGSFLKTWEIFLNKDIEGALEGLKNAHWGRIQFRRKAS